MEERIERWLKPDIEIRPLDQAMMLAYEAHKGQFDKQGQPYFLHVRRVALVLGSSQVYQIIGILHDILEDTSITKEDLYRAGFGTVIVGALELLTRRIDEDYFDYIERLSHNPVARKVKIADLEDNLKTWRGPLGDNQIAKYKTALLTLRKKEENGSCPANKCFLSQVPTKKIKRCEDEGCIMNEKHNGETT